MLIYGLYKAYTKEKAFFCTCSECRYVPIIEVNEFMLLFIAAGIVLAKFRKYRIAPIFKAYTLYPLFFVELIYIFFQVNIFLENYYYLKFAGILQIVFMAVLLFPILRYKLYIPAIVGSGLTVLGTLANKLAIALNSGKMPVYPTLSKLTGYFKEDAIAKGNDGIHILGNAYTKCKILTDYIDIGWTVYSIGDIMIHAFVTIIVFYTIKSLNTDREVNKI